MQEIKVHSAIILPDLRGGGAERVAVNLSNGLVARGYSVDMVLLSATGEFLTALRPEVNVIDLKVSRVRWALGPLVRYLRSRRPSVMLACMWPLTILVPLARVIARVPVRLIVAEHTTWSRSELLKRPTLGWQIRTSMHHFFPKVEAIVTVSQGAADDLARFADLNRKAISVIYNPVVGAALPPLADRRVADGWWSGPHKRLLAVGTLTKVKDYTTLLKSFALLRQKEDVRLLILGEGECRIDLQALVRQLDIETSVFMPGFVSNPWSYYSRADLHVLSSTAEGLPTVMIEALAAGTPVVSTDCPSGPREILCDGQFGRLVPVGDVASLADAMRASLMEVPNRTALIMRAQDFSIDKAVDQYEQLLYPTQLAEAGK